MRLQAVEMQGFKSFPEKTRISFGRGVTAVIGPNGSGKSNISDAVRWVLGEMSMKSLRGSKMEDVIFNGAEGIPAANYAYVTLELDTGEEHSRVINQSMEETQQPTGKISLSDNPVTAVTRKYYRTGDSEYFINKKQVRLKDIYELFYDTGIGREGYSVISQGKISEVLSQKSEERRSIFEEAAGISRFRNKKTEAERKLKEAENNIERVSDIAGEISNRIGPLEKEAENAKQYLIFSQEKKALEITLWLDKIDSLRKNKELFSIKTQESKQNLDQITTQIEGMEKTLDQSINGGYELSRDISAAEREKSQAQGEKSLVLNQNAVATNDIEHLTRTYEENKERWQRNGEELVFATEKLEQTKLLAQASGKEYAEILPEIDKEQEKHTLACSRTQEFKRQSEECGNILHSLQDEFNSLATQKARTESELEYFEKAADQGREKIKLSSQRVEELTAQGTETKVALEEKNSLISSITTKILAGEKEKQELLVKKDKLREEIVLLRLALTKDEQKREHLTRLEQMSEGYGDSAKKILAAGKNGTLQGIHGGVGSLISTQGQYAVALETALMGAVQYIVTDDEIQAKAAISYLKNNNLGRATFLPLTTIKGRKADVSEIKNIKGYIGIASQLAEYDSKYENIINDLLGRTIVAADMDSATAIARGCQYRLKIVTCDGQVINSGGSYTGGAPIRKSGILTRAADIKELSDKIRKTNSDIILVEKQIRGLEGRIAELEQEHTNLSLEEQEAKEEAQALNHSYQGILVRLEEEQKNKETLTAQIEKDKGESVKAQIEELEQKSKLLTQKIQDKQQEQSIFAMEAENAAKEENLIYQRLNQLKITLAEKKGIMDRDQESTQACQSKIEELKARREQAQSAMESLLVQTEAKKAEIKSRECAIATLEQSIAEKSAEIEALLCQREQKEKEINTLRSQIKEVQSHKEEAYVAFATHQGELEKANNSLEEITARLWDEYELTYSGGEEYRLPAEKMDKAPSRLNSLKNKIKAMGSINVNAVEEYKREKERLDFLTLQLEDLDKTRRSLDSTISKLSHNMKTMFLESFEEINKNFGEVFRDLFGGGQANISLEDPSDPLECGINIMLKPPGKTVKNISLLSGGEQSFAAIALYLALQKINPSPFCIFDEIETALDDVNLAKFADFVRLNSQKTQYILITHRRGTMERADIIYGVTMRKKGVSDYLELNLAKIEENIKEYTR